MRTAKLFQNGQSQAVRLPQEFSFNSTQVFIKKVGETVLLIPYQESWQALFDSLDQFSDDFMENREQPEQQIRESLGMKYLLDTNICIYVIKRKPLQVLQKFSDCSIGEIGVSSITKPTRFDTVSAPTSHRRF